MPQYVKQILDGTKKYEYRRSVPKNNFDTILIYSTFPDMRVVAMVDVKKVVCLPVKQLWNKTSRYSGISKSGFMNYFKNKQLGYAYELGKVRTLGNIKIDKFGIKHPPQNFIYMSVNEIKKAGIII